MEKNDIGIVDFFKYLNEITDLFVTSIEVKPIRIKKDMYITGFRRIGISFIEAHVKHIKQLMIKSNDYTMEMPLKETPEAEMWIDIELLSQDTIRTAFNELRNYFYQLNTYTIAVINYKLKSDPNNLCSQEEVIIYDNKRLACKETIAKRKLCTMFKSHFIHWGAKEKEKEYVLSEEEIAEMA